MTARKKPAITQSRNHAPLPPTADRLGKLPRRVVVGIYLDDQVLAEFTDADRELTAARERLDASRPRRLAQARAAASPEDVVDGALFDEVAAEDLAVMGPLEEAATAALDAMDAATTWFIFRALGRTPYRDLLAKHPPRDEDHEAMEAAGEAGRAPYNMATLPQALIQASCMDPVLSDLDIEAIFDGTNWNEVEVSTLLVHAQLAQSQAPVADVKRHRG